MQIIWANTNISILESHVILYVFWLVLKVICQWTAKDKKNTVLVYKNEYVHRNIVNAKYRVEREKKKNNAPSEVNG
jgi:hypothetical protein